MKTEADVPPGPAMPHAECAPSHCVAFTNSPAGDVLAVAATTALPSPPSEPELRPAVIAGPGDSSEQYFIRISADTLAEIAPLVEAAPRTLDAAGKSQITELQRVLHRFGQTHTTRPETLSPISLLREVQARLDDEATQNHRLQEQFDELGDIVDAEGKRADEEAARANETAVLLNEHRTLVARLLASPPPDPAPNAARQNLIKIAEPDAYSGSRDGLRKFKKQLTLVMAD